MDYIHYLWALAIFCMPDEFRQRRRMAGVTWQSCAPDWRQKSICRPCSPLFFCPRAGVNGQHHIVKLIHPSAIYLAGWGTNHTGVWPWDKGFVLIDKWDYHPLLWKFLQYCWEICGRNDAYWSLGNCQLICWSHIASMDWLKLLI